MRRLELPSVRALEDLLITDCFYSGLFKGKLDQRNRCGSWRHVRMPSPYCGVCGLHAGVVNGCVGLPMQFPVAGLPWLCS